MIPAMTPAPGGETPKDFAQYLWDECVFERYAVMVRKRDASIREECAKIAESLYGKTYWDDPAAGIAAMIEKGA